MVGGAHPTTVDSLDRIIQLKGWCAVRTLPIQLDRSVDGTYRVQGMVGGAHPTTVHSLDRIIQLKGWCRISIAVVIHSIDRCAPYRYNFDRTV